MKITKDLAIARSLCFVVVLSWVLFPIAASFWAWLWVKEPIHDLKQEVEAIAAKLPLERRERYTNCMGGWKTAELYDMAMAEAEQKCKAAETSRCTQQTGEAIMREKFRVLMQKCQHGIAQKGHPS
jgi:hypothetical protein